MHKQKKAFCRCNNEILWDHGTAKPYYTMEDAKKNGLEAK